MISSVIIDPDYGTINKLESLLLNNCPNLEVRGSASDLQHLDYCLINLKPDLAFVHISFANVPIFCVLEHSMELVFLSEAKPSTSSITPSVTVRHLHLHKPIQTSELIRVVSHAHYRVNARKERKENLRLIENLVKFHPQREIIGIPIIEGYEFIAVEAIIRCEGLQKCTRITTKENGSFVSSYNLGEFRRLLEPYGFFITHRSFLINLQHIKRYHKEGTIVMTDDSIIPLARRRKEEFLKHIRKI